MPELTRGDRPLVSGLRQRGNTDSAQALLRGYRSRRDGGLRAKETPETRRKGWVRRTRAATIEKLVSTGFIERKKAKKTVNLIPANTGVSLITILPEQLQSPLLTAEWENKLKQVERGELDAAAFLDGITEQMRELTKSYKVIRGAEVLFPSGREVIGKCPRCGGDVAESKKGFFCEKNDCRFGLWKDNKFLTAKRINLMKADAAALLNIGRVHVKNAYSEKTGKNFDADLLLEDNGERSVYRFDFGKEGGNNEFTVIHTWAMAGGLVGVVVMCLCFVSGEQSRMEERERGHG